VIDNTARPHHSVAVPDPHPSLSLVAVRDHRERAIQLLTDSFANDLISIEEFERRLGRLHAAGGLAEVDAVVADLRPAPAGAASTSLAPLRVDAALTAPRRRVTSLFGNVERRGAWTVPAELEARAVFGHVELDFRDARFSAATTELDVRVVFGALEIIVPPQLAVECEGSSIFGSVENYGGGAVADPDRPLLRVRGTAVFGSVEVHTRLPGESAADAWRRHKRALRRA
jgi:hypothetical protein